ncbi:hypothetical protein HF576_00365 [Microbacterium sp. CFH 90308]|uniref:Uncharacterized protein n=1 Tax=Microbacterium salsuginis TaxID=2722803 RepID=A0ABX1K614_9MICO|nr:hypothetical protein [Microbacterium sp. CFH 90308]NLP82294.1 hypothetical protein [Microbacterium sp. CFH 90308]
MHDVLAALAGAAATPTPTPTPQVDPELVTPGVEGFVITALVAVAVILLVWDMLRRIRRGRVRADIEEELQAELDAQEQGDRAVEATDTDDQRVDPGDEPPART